MTGGCRQAFKSGAALRDGSGTRGIERRSGDIDGVGGVDLADEIGLVLCGEEGFRVCRVFGFEAEGRRVGRAEVVE